jgi:periplasmic protein TonB
MQNSFISSLVLHVLIAVAMIWAGQQSDLKHKPLPEATVVKLVRPKPIAPVVPVEVSKEFKIPETAPPLKIPAPNKKEVEKKPEPKKEEPKPRSTQEVPKELKGEAGTLKLQQPGFEYDFYLALVQSKIERNFRPPPGMRGQAMAMISFTIEKDGAISGISLALSSGNLLIDQSAERAVRAAGRFPPLPPQYEKGELGINFEFVVNPATGG